MSDTAVRSARQRKSRAHRGRVTAFAAVLVLGALMGGTLMAVNAWSGQRQEVLQAVSTYRLAVVNEQGALSDGDQTTVPQLRDIQRQAGSALAQLESSALSDSVRANVSQLDRVYQAAVTQEIDAVAAWRPDVASHLDLTAVDPAFEPLDLALGGVFDDATRGAKLGAAVDDVVSVLVVGAAAVVTMLMMVLAGRRRDNTAVADAHATSLAEAARLTAERERNFRAIFDGNPQPMFVSERGRPAFPRGQ